VLTCSACAVKIKAPEKPRTFDQLNRSAHYAIYLVRFFVFRGRYRTSFEHPAAITPNEPLLYKFGLPTVNHVFLPGHRIMVQVQSTLFPLYDRNPQTFVPNIFDARKADYQKATQRIWHTPEKASFINLPVVP